MNQFYRLFTLLILIGWSSSNLTIAQNFGNEIQIPAVLDSNVILLNVDETTHNFDPNFTEPKITVSDTLYKNNVPTFGYNPRGSDDGTYLGPTLIWHHDSLTKTSIRNNLNERTTVHWHGAHIPARTDGGPHQPIGANGAEWNIEFTILDDVTTLWYHPHLEDSTFIQVEKGLSGIIIIEDANDPVVSQIPHSYGFDDLPIIVQDHTFDLDSNNASQPYTINLNKNTGSSVVINGVINPYANVGPQMTQFRVLNGSSRQFYLLEVVDSLGNIVPGWLIGSDAGYLNSPIQVDSFATGPGIRNEIVYDFSPYSGQNLYLRNAAATLQAAWPGKVTLNRRSSGVNENIMEIRVGTSLVGPDPITTQPPSTLENYPTFDTSAVSKVRPMRLQPSTVDTNNVNFSINGNQFVLEHINDTIMLDATEEWHVINQSKAAHPFHIHDVHVDVIAVFDSLGNELTPIPAEWQGRQDNMLVPSGWQVNFVTQFTDFADTLWTGDPARTAENGYMYHCHILTHEDGYYVPNFPTTTPHGMMQQFLVWNGITIVATPEAVSNFGDNVIFYPNPASDILHLQGESKRASLFCLYDVTGKRILREELSPFNGVKTFNVSNLNQGMYLVEWTNDQGGKYTQRVSLQR